MTDIRHIEGQANRVADTLSHNVFAREQSPIDFDVPVSAQDNDKGPACTGISFTLWADYSL